MRAPTPTVVVPALSLALLLAAPVLGQEQPKAPPAATEPVKDDVLSGPKVKETKSERSLVKRNFQGRVQRLEIPPAEAAIELLGLDAATAAKVKEVVDDRAKAMDKVVRENLDLLLKFQNTGDRRGRLQLLRESKEKFAEVDAKGRLEDRVAKVLPKDQAERYQELIRGYWDTLLADAEQEAAGAKDRPGKVEILAREVLLAFGAEVKRSYERQLGSKVKDLEELLGKLGLSAEKEAKVRTYFVQYAEQTKGRPTENQRRDLFFKVMRELDRDQQKALLEQVLGGSKKAQSPDAPMKEDPMQGEPMKDEGAK
jgi:hypothetical protein